MLLWLEQNLGTIVIALLLAALVVLIICGMRKDRRAGKRSCGGSCGSCAGCAMKGRCGH
ncbi:MAG: FeoB-associated Cys-rich membrane protein [Clostridia bacterium]|nr:FeoB-associated Cys-rich membrane protein [Clostridia bacterium]